MKVKKVYDSEADIPSEYASLYEERDGKWHLTLEVEGAGNADDVTRLNGALAKERKDHKDTKDKLRAFDGLEPEDVRTKLDKLADLEAGGNLPDEEKVAREVERRVKAAKAPIERERDTFKRERDEAIAERDQVQGTLKGRTIADEVRSAASKAKIIDSAVDDVLMYGNSVFEIDESGNVVTRDGVGVAPGLKPDAWLSDMKEKRPHWWPASQGAGSQGGRGGGSPLDNPFTFEGWNVTEQGKMAQADPAKAERMARMAGTTLGGPKPQPRQRAA